MKIYIKTFGCKVNQYESEKIAEQLNNFNFVDDFKIADIVIINSCTVTAEADRKLMQYVRKVKRENSNTIIMLVGCFAKFFLQENKKIDEIDVIVKNKNNLLGEIVNYFRKIDNFDIQSSFLNKKNSENTNIFKHTRAFLKIEDGCNKFCSYCIIPYIRGRVKSKKLNDIQNEAKILAKKGFKEIVLIGIDLTSYGIDIQSNLCEAVNVVCGVKNIERVRLGSLEPTFFSNYDIINKLSQQNKLCNQFHVSLQSGSDKILKLMNRRYTAEEFVKNCENIRNFFDDATITTDLIVGFPSETESDFNFSLEIIKKTKLLKTHVFPFSARIGTRAANFSEQVISQVKSQRAKKAIEIAQNVGQIVQKKFIGKTMEVLYEKYANNSNFFGYTKNYIPVRTFSVEDIRQKILNTKIVDIEKNFCIGELN